MKVAFLTPRMIVGGAETYIICKCNWLRNHDHQAIILSEGGENVDNIPDGVKHFVVESISQPPYALSYSNKKKMLFTISSILLEEKVDVIEAHNTFPIIYALLSYKHHKKPFILNVLNEESYRRNFQLSFITAFLSKYALYFTLTSQMNQYIEKKVHVSLLPHIIPIPIESCGSHDVYESSYILSVCRMSSDKMYIKHLIEGFRGAKISKLIPSNITLVIVGDGILFDKVSDIVEKANRDLHDSSIILKGTVVGEQLHDLYKHCLFYVGMGITMLTAASYGKACLMVGMQRECQPFVWGYWGNNPAMDKNSIVANRNYTNRKFYKDAITNAVNNYSERQEMGKKALSLLSANYSVSKIMNEWLFQYEMLSKVFPISCLNFMVFISNLYNLLVHIVYVLFKRL